MKRFTLLFVLLLLFNCAEQEKDVIATVNGSNLTKQEFEQYVPDVDYQQIGEDRIQSFLDDWVQQEILYLQAKKLGMHQEDSVKFVLEQYTKNFLAMELVRRAFGPTTVTEQEIRDALRGVANPPGETINPGVDGWAAALDALAAGGDTNYEGAASPVDLDENGDVLKGAIEVWQVVDGEITVQETREIDLTQ